MTSTDEKKAAKPAPSKRSAPARPGDGKPASGLRVVANVSGQSAETIDQLVDPGALMDRRGPGQVVPNPASKSVEEIQPAPATSNVPRLANGFKIVRNRAYQRVQKINRQKLRAPVSDEMDYKKLFTAFEEAFLAQDIDAIGDCLSPAFQWHLPNGKVVYGRKEALEEMELRFAMPNLPRFSRTMWRFEGTTVLQSYEVEYMGPDGRWRQSKGFDLYEIGDGLITLKDAYWKMIP